MLAAILQPLLANGAYGLDTPAPVGPFLNGVFPTQTPNAPGSSTWTVVPAFPDVKVNDTLVIVPNPANNRMYVGSREGEIRSFVNDQAVGSSDVFLDLRDRVAAVWDAGLLGMVFHPEFGVPGSPYRNFFYVYYSSNCRIDVADTTRVDLSTCTPFPTDVTWGYFGAYLRLSRFSVVDGSPVGHPVVDPDSEFVMLNIRLYNSSHYGGGMAFGNPLTMGDDYLYLTIGDQFRYTTAQDIAQTLEGGTFRLDVNIIENKDASWSCRGSNHKPIRTFPVPELVGTGVAPLMGEHFTDEVSGQRYCIPHDNPWVGEAGVFEEYNSLGHRNPHRLAIDSITGRLWSGEVGENTHEEINIIQTGHNYGWPYREGLAAFMAEPAGFTYRGIFTDPVIDFNRSDAGAIIGGYVYRGSTYPELSGRYMAGDYVTGKIWAITLDESSLTATKEEIASFTSIGRLGTWGQDNNGEVYLGNVAAQNDTLYQLQRVTNPIPDPPSLLSQTFAFTDLGNLQAANFFVPYTLNEPFWSDGALKKRWIALPNDGTRDTPAEQIAFSPTSDWVYPAGTVLMKHFELALDDTDPNNTTRLETRFLVLGSDGRWYGVTYHWRPDQSDADLLTTAQTQDYQIVTEGGGSRSQTWLFPGRDQCLSCHSPGAGGAAGPRTHRLNGDFTYPSTGITDNQLRTWNHLGMFTPALDEAAIPGYLKSAAKDDPNASLERRARSYLDVNCSYCHRPGTGNRAFFDMRFTTPLASQGLVYGAVIDNLGISGAYLITPDDTSTSIVFHRANTASPSPTAMPPLAKSLVDTAGMALLVEWIQSIDPTLYVNRALNRPVAVSSVENAGLSAAAAVDGDSATRWSSAFSDPQWIAVDLGAVYPINHVVLNWEVAYGKAYRIEVSTDGSHWNQVFSETNGDGGTDDIVFGTTSARYVRLWGTARGTPWGYSLYEFEVYGATDNVSPVATGTLQYDPPGR